MLKKCAVVLKNFLCSLLHPPPYIWMQERRSKCATCVSSRAHPSPHFPVFSPAPYLPTTGLTCTHPRGFPGRTTLLSNGPTALSVPQVPSPTYPAGFD